MIADFLTDKIEETSSAFSSRFDKLFTPQAPFSDPEYSEFSKAMLSNLVGGVGYFYGSGLVDRSAAPEYDEENEGFWEEAAEARSRVQPTEEEPRELFTSIPSRPFFPRGFLWDEGFHLIPVIDWDTDLALDIVKSWFNLIDEDGWIGREQILGLEARNKVPPEFAVQYPHYANPPTLFLILEAFVDKLKFNETITKHSDLEREGIADSLRSAHLENQELAESYLRSIYPLLKRQYFWFKKTQWGDVNSYDREAYSSKEAYRWRGRTVQHILTSGLDDYPRAQPPHPGELHVDLISWMGLLSRSIRRIAESIGESEDAEEFAVYENAITRNIDDLHWDEDAQTWCDATIDDFEENVHVCHKGYISIFPFLTGMVGPDSPRLKATLDLIRNPEELWSDYGIRSLSKNDPFYGTEENYWRSPVWINMNYMVLKSLYVCLPRPLFTNLENMILTFVKTRILPHLLVLTRRKRPRSTLSSARTLSKMFSENGKEPGSPGNSTTQTTARASESSTLPAGQVWLLR
jgi:mannosyl-oligosaccharide glucosidase